MVPLGPALLDPSQNLVDPGAVLLGTVQDEIQLRHMPFPQALQQLAPDISPGSVDCLKSLLAFVFIAFNLQEDARALAVRRERDLAYRAQGDSRIAQFTLDNGANLFLERLTYPF